MQFFIQAVLKRSCKNLPSSTFCGWLSTEQKIGLKILISGIILKLSPMGITKYCLSSILNCLFFYAQFTFLKLNGKRNYIRQHIIATCDDSDEPSHRYSVTRAGITLKIWYGSGSGSYHNFGYIVDMQIWTFIFSQLEHIIVNNLLQLMNIPQGCLIMNYNAFYHFWDLKKKIENFKYIC